MNILVIGGGGREHALAWKLREGAGVEKVFCAPGNGGIQSEAECIPLDLNDVKAAADIAAKVAADLTVVGPELPLVSGIADEFARRDLKILGPTQAAARLEGSKVFAKKFMERHGIPCPTVYGIFDNSIDAYSELCAVDWPLVIKADGLCAGKGVLVTSSPDEATAFIDRVMEQREFGDSGRHVILEEGLTGQELSYIILTDGRDFIPMAPTRDYKRAFEGDEGPNTGGMGAYSSDDILGSALETTIVATVVRPTLKGLAADGIPYCGFLYFGLMLTQDGPKVLEFNCRLGDPEAEVILLRADFDFTASCAATVSGNLRSIATRWSPAAAVCVVLASPGYPGAPVIGRAISGLPVGTSHSQFQVFHAGTRKDGTEYYTNGGRVMMVCGAGDSLPVARTVAYDAVRNISFDGANFRRDIASGVQRSAALYLSPM